MLTNTLIPHYRFFPNIVKTRIGVASRHSQTTSAAGALSRREDRWRCVIRKGSNRSQNVIWNLFVWTIARGPTFHD